MKLDCQRSLCCPGRAWLCCLHDRLFTGSNSPVAQLSQFTWVAFTRQDRIDDRQPGGPSQVTDDVMELYVYLVECFLHVLKVDSREFNEVIAVTP